LGIRSLVKRLFENCNVNVTVRELIRDIDHVQTSFILKVWCQPPAARSRE
jgi:hypothetical protein